MRIAKKTLYNAPVFFRQKHKNWIRISFHDVIYIESFKEMSVLHLKDQNTITCRYPLSYIQTLLPSGFERIHRSLIVNINHINDINLAKKLVCINEHTQLKYGENYKENLLKYFNEVE